MIDREKISLLREKCDNAIEFGILYEIASRGNYMTINSLCSVMKKERKEVVKIIRELNKKEVVSKNKEIISIDSDVLGESIIVNSCLICKTEILNDLYHLTKNDMTICKQCCKEITELTLKFEYDDKRLVDYSFDVDKVIQLNNRKMSKSLREKIFEKYNNQCNYCNSKTNLVVDHIFPISKGGDSKEENLQVLCAPCNARKGSKVIDE